MKEEYPYFKKYAAFILKTQLDAIVWDMIKKAREINLPILKQLAQLTEEQLFQISKEGFVSDILKPLIYRKPFDKIYESSKNWKANAIIIPKDQINIYDITSIYHVRKISLIDFLDQYEYTKKEGIELNKEIENYFTKCIDIGLEAYEEIQRSALKNSQEILNGILANIPVIVSRVDKKGYLKESLGSGLSALGAKDNDLIGTNIFENYPEAENTRRAINGEKIIFEGVAKGKSGEIRHYQSYFFPEEKGAIGFSIDITERKQVEEKLKESEYFIQQIADSTPIILQVYDKINSQEIYANQQLAELLGYSGDQINTMGKSISQLIVHPEDIKKLAARNEGLQHAKDGEVIESEMRAKHADGSYRWILTKSKVFKRTEEGKVWQTLSTSIDTTEKKTSEEKLQQQLRIFDTALSNTIDFNYIFDLHGKFIYVNKPLLDLWGISKEEAHGKNFKELGYPDDLAKLHNSQIEQLLKTKLPITAENSYTNHQGKIGYYQYTFVPVFGENGKIEAIAGTTHDITELKANAEQQYRSIFESSNDAILIYDYNGDIVEVNPAANKMYGYSYEEMIGMNVKKIVDPLDYEKVFKDIELVKTGHQFNNQGKHFKKDGTYLFIEVTGSGFIFKGKPHLLAIIRDVTERRNAEVSLRESEDRFRTMADNIPNLAWIAEKDGAITWYNKRWFEYTGTSPEQMVGWGWQQVHDPKHLSRVIEGWTTAIKTGMPFEMVFPLKGADGKYRPFLTRVIPVKDEQGKIVKWFGTNTDITAQIEAEEILEKKNEELQKINNDLDNFIYTASHDLKSPVSNLEGLLNLVSDVDEDLITEKGREVLPLVHKSLKRLNLVIRELTEIAKIQKDIDADKESISLKDLTDEILLSFEDEIKKFKGKIIIDFSLEPIVWFSKRNLRSLLYNLLSNALKYSSPDRDGIIKLTTERSEDYIVLSVSDNGLGIPENYKEKVFTMFKRFHTHIEGAGVGLYIVKRIIENYGGKIELETKENKGSIFKIYFKY